MKDKAPSRLKQIIYGLLIAIAVIVAVVVAVSSLSPTFYLKSSKVIIEIGEDFDPVSQIGSFRSIDVNDIEIQSDVDTQKVGSYTVTYKYLMKTQTLTVEVEDRDYPVFSIKDNLDYYMSTEFDINKIVMSITDKTGVTAFSWKEVEGGIGIPGTAKLQLSASDAYGHKTVNTATVNVIDDIPPILKLKSFTEKVEAGADFDPMVFVETATDNYGTPAVTYKINSGTLAKVGKVKATLYATDTAGNVTSAEVSFTTVDTTAPTVTEKAEKHVHKMSKKLDPSMYFDIYDNSEKTKTTYEIVSGDLTQVGVVTVAVHVEDYYGNSTDAGIISIEVEDDIPPVFTLTHSRYNIDLGRYFDVDALIASASDNSGEAVTFSYKVKSGSLNHAGECTVNIIATDIYGNSSTTAVPFNVIDKVAPVISLNKDKATHVIGEAFTLDNLVKSCTDNDAVSSIEMQVVEGSLDEVGDAIVEIIAKDPSGNTAKKRVEVKSKTRLYQTFGTEENVDITGIDGMPYMVAVNRYMGVATVYGKDENWDYTVPIQAMLCSVGKNSALEEYFGVRSGSGLTPLGVYNVPWKTSTGWHTLFSNDDYHKNVYGQYAVRITGSILFHSVPYFWGRKDALEWTGTPDNLNHEFNKLGSPASMGCIRLCVRDIKWLNDNCPVGTLVVIYDERDNYGPLGRPDNFIIDPTSEMFADIDPEIFKLSGYYTKDLPKEPEVSQNPLNWDPTDPDTRNPWIPILEAWEKKQQEEAEAGEGEGNPSDDDPDSNPDKNPESNPEVMPDPGAGEEA